MKNVADGLKYALKWVLFTWTQGPIPPNLRELTEWISVLLKMLTCLESQTFRGKWAENRPGALCLFGFFCFSIFFIFFYFSFCVCVGVCVCFLFWNKNICSDTHATKWAGKWWKKLYPADFRNQNNFCFWPYIKKTRRRYQNYFRRSFQRDLNYSN